MKIRIPLQTRFVDGIACHRPAATLRIRSHYGDFAILPFVIDTGADLTSIPISLAAKEGIQFRRTLEVTTGGLVGRTTSFRDRIEVVIDSYEYNWPCHFVNTPPGARATEAVLGRAGFLSAFNFGICDEHLILTRRGSFANRWEHLWSFLGRPFVRQCSAIEPL